MMTANSLPPLRGELRAQEPMAAHTSWRVGGPAERFYRPADLEDLANFLRRLAPEDPLLWLGLGSNLLVRDGGIRGAVLFTLGALDELRWSDHNRLYAGAGVTCAKVAKTAARMGMTGAEFLAGIPGTLGGALAMNAGAFGSETWTRVATVRSIDRQGELHQRTPAEYVIGYRSVAGPDQEWFVGAELELEPGDVAQAQARIKALLAQRGATQPTQQPSCGSVFRNPEGDHAARLIEGAGLKGRRHGGAQVSDKHANFIVNVGDASAADIEALIQEVQAEVQKVHGIELQPEVRIVGEALGS